MTDCRSGDGSPLRPDLTPMPERMRRLPVVRGYPVPWFVDWIGAVPEFRAMDHKKLMTAIVNKVCWVCGEPLGRNMTFVSGPMCGINRVSAEPPCHLECATWSAINCPFLNNPEFERRDTPFPENTPRENAAGMMIMRNPGCTMLWTTRSYSVMRVNQRGAKPGVLFAFGEPTKVEWYHRGGPATREQVEHSVTTGLPILEQQCRDDDDRRTLEHMRKGILPYLPKA